MAHNFRQDNPAARSYALVAVLLIISLVCMVGYAREGDGGFLHSLQLGTANAFMPARAAAGGIEAAEYSAFSAAQDSNADASTLSELRQQNEELRQSVAQLEEYRQEAQRLQSLLDFQDLYDLEGVTATVLARSGDSWNDVVTIGKGSADGISAGLPVAGPTGLVGQVVSVNEHSSEVRLLQDPQSGVAVMIQSNREQGILKGSLDGLLYLENLSDDAEVKVGDVIITSGLGGSFFRGIIVGTVAKVEGEAGSTSRRIVVEPNESTGPLQEVMVITAMNSDGALSKNFDADGSSSSSSSSSSGDGESSDADSASSDSSGSADSASTDGTASADTSTYYDDSTTYYDDSTYADTSTYYDDTGAYSDGTTYYDDSGAYSGDGYAG